HSEAIPSIVTGSQTSCEGSGVNLVFDSCLRRCSAMGPFDQLAKKTRSNLRLILAWVLVIGFYPGLICFGLRGRRRHLLPQLPIRLKWQPDTLQAREKRQRPL
ncbi:MAG: hypothetical protein WBO48_02960, partial [Candidatus Promineifilaceae bacterium]